MVRVKHRVGIVASQQDIWAALTEPERISGWWASSAEGGSEPGELLHLDFKGLATLSFQVMQSQKYSRLHLKNLDGPGAWKDSGLEFHLEPSEGQVFVVLLHYSGQASEDDFQYFMTKWPIYLVSLKSYLETGKGQPFPNDLKIQADL